MNTESDLVDPSSYIFVPGYQDTNAPGAYFRLGAYSNIELEVVDSSAGLGQFYPRAHLKDDLSGVYFSAGTSDTGATLQGIMLACSGRLLIRNSEKTYVHSTGAINIDTESDLDIKADGNITAISGGTIHISTETESGDITITAGGGNANFKTKALSATHELMGEEWKSTTQNSYSYYACDVYNWKQGGTWDFVAAGKFSYYAGVGLSITTSLDVTISSSIACTFFLMKVDMGLWKVEFCAQKIEVKVGEVKVGDWAFKGYGTKMENALLFGTIAAVATVAHGVSAVQKSVSSTLSSVESGIGSLKSEIKTLFNIL